MARPRKDEGLDTPTSEVESLRKELAALKAQVKAQKVEPLEEIRRISEKSQQDSGMTVRVRTDHKTVALYHTNGLNIGKKVGPLHPGLLQYTYAEFRKKGITLSTTKPTEEEVAEYKQSEEYKSLFNRHKEVKPHRFKTPSATDTQRTIASFAKLLGVKPEEAIQLSSKEAVLK